MSGPSNNEIVTRLSELSRLLDAKTSEIGRLDETAVRAKSRHMVTFAKAFLTGEGSVDARKQSAVLVCEREWLDAEIAEQQVRAAREAIRTLRDQLDVGRSIGAAVRSEFVATGYGQQT